MRGIIITVLLFSICSFSFALERSDIMPEEAYGWMYYAEGWSIDRAWGENVDFYVRFCHPEYEGMYMPYIRQVIAYLKNITGINFFIHWNAAVPVNSDKPNLYIGDPKVEICCYDGNSYGYTSTTKACIYRRNSYVIGNSAFISEKKAKLIYFYREIASITTAFNTNWSSNYWSSVGETIFSERFGYLNVPSPLDDQLLHITAVWNEDLRKPWNTDYKSMASLAAQMRVEDVPIIALPLLYRVTFAKFWNNNSSWCPTELHIEGNNFTINTYLNLIYPEDSFTEHWYHLTLKCYWDYGINTLVCPVSQIIAVPERPQSQCTGAFAYLVDTEYPLRLRLYRVSLGPWSNVLESGRFVYLEFSINTSINAFVLVRYGLVNPFSP